MRCAATAGSSLTAVRTAAVLPMKRFDAAKRRLAADVGTGWRRALAEAMFSDVLTALRRTAAIDAIIVVSGDHVAQQIAGGHGAVTVDDHAEAGHSAAADLGVIRARKLGCDRVALVPGDCPALDPGELEELLAAPVEGTAAVGVVPDRHGEGTNALLLTPPDAMAAAFGPGSRARHVERAEAAGVACRVHDVPSLALDIDTPDDLAALIEALGRRRGNAAHTRGLLSRMARTAQSAAS